MKSISFLAGLLAATQLLFTISGTAQEKTFGKWADQKATSIVAKDISTYESEEKYAHDWTVVKAEDVLWNKRAWRTIELSDKENALLNTPALGAPFIDILIKGALGRQFKVYSSQDDRFTKELTPDDINLLLSGPAPWLQPNAVHSFRVKEDWIYIASQKTLVARIIGIAPLVTVTDESGNKKDEPAFWIYFPYMREYLRSHTLAQASGKEPKNLDEVLESRHFKATIDEVRTMPGM